MSTDTDRKRMKQAKLPPMRFESTDGYPIYVGRNNRQNDELTFRLARKDDIWCHASKVHGSHVIISCGGHGSLLLDENGVEHIVPTAKVKLVNATGAGDSMVAGFLAKVTSGEDYETALIFASACGTATAASNGIAKRSKIDRVVTALYKKMGRAMPGTIARDIEENRARAEANEGITVKSE